MSTKPQEPDGLAIRNTALRRYLTMLALKTTARFYKWDGPCVPVSRSIMVKKGKRVVGLTEAATMAFIAARTKIPVPRVHCSFTCNHSTYVVMERIPGKTLADAWPALSDSELEHIFSQLRDMLRELRALPAPGTAIESCVGGSLRDSRIPWSRARFGPFPSTLAFHRWLRQGLEPGQFPNRERDNGEDWVDIKRMVAMQDDREWPSPVFTHGDLNPFNIIVRDAKIVAIIDWEFSGWYPYYWEYTSAWLGNKTRGAWQKVVPKFLEPCQDELQMEKIRQRWWGDF
ncbi:Protein kinase-like domain protein [Metarhizium album ARSEF 1941]|uniref:Protein kinase-like domain protein n=1 Tax=Metarhizium album (strain ARSEF 1941) TaxID=1081103 RepID=A0A0B2X4G0_METAS|nr:Protein kinase-like domain protein [Metarhizium album ARSEF 1941]KHO00643.1 Protein kinase-like domain protein [Metarhizium album ARSEF 1941]